jgi:hypothetical protein
MLNTKVNLSLFLLQVLAFFTMVWMTQSQTQPTMRRPQFKITDDEFNWYKPVAVILKPASK